VIGISERVHAVSFIKKNISSILKKRRGFELCGKTKLKPVSLINYPTILNTPI
jgi:hypothetical protein